MSDNCCQPSDCGKKSCMGTYILAVIGALLLVSWVVKLTRAYTAPAPIAAARVQERLKNIADLRAENAKTLETYDWVDQAKGIVRLPIERSKEITLQEWQNPAAARANMMERAAKKFYVPPAAPPPPNPYE